MTLVGICGLGVVGSAIESVFRKRNVNLVVYDKYKNGGIGTPDSLLSADMIFLLYQLLIQNIKEGTIKQPFMRLQNI